MQIIGSWKTRTPLTVSPAWLIVTLVVLPLLAADTGFPMQARKLTPVETDLRPLGESLYANIVRSDGKLSFCTNDIRAIDQVLERYRARYPEAVAEVRYNLAIKHWTVFNEPTLAVQRLRALQRDMPGNAFAVKAARDIDSIPKASAGRALRKTLKPGMEFPDFDEEDMDGQPLSIKRFRGKPVVIVTWTIETAPVLQFKKLEILQRKLGPQSFEIIGLNADEAEAPVRNYLRTNNIRWPQYFGGKGREGDVLLRYGIETFADYSFILDAAGRIVAISPNLFEDLEKAVMKAAGTPK